MTGNIGEIRWLDGEACPECESKEVSKRGKDEVQPTSGGTGAGSSNSDAGKR
jgi:hypothetical protein